MVDCRAIARAITDPENQPHQWNDQDLAKFFVSAADLIERLQEALDILQAAMVEKKPIPMRFKKAILNANSALQQKESK